MHSKKLHQRVAFTLVELLVVISIIAMMLAILMPSLSKARGLAKATVCGAQLRSIGTVFLLYAANYNDELPPSFAGGNWNAFYDFTRDALDKYGVKDGKIFYCPGYNKSSKTLDMWKSPSPTGYGRNIYYMGYQLFTNAIRADMDPLRMPSPWALANGIDKALPFSSTPTLSWHYSFVHAVPELQDILPMRKTTDSVVRVKIYGTTYTKKVSPARNPMVFDEALSRGGSFTVSPTDASHVANNGKCLGINAVFVDGHVKWRNGNSLKVFRDYGIYGGVSLKKWF